MEYVYKFLDFNDKVIYVGKTSDFKRRMREHFTKGHLPYDCYQNVAQIYYASTGMSKYDNEIVETLLIDNLKPEYNTEKVFIEHADKAQYQLPNLVWKKLYVNHLYPELVSTVPFPYTFFSNENGTKKQCRSLIEWNLNILKNRRGYIVHLFPDIFSSVYDPMLDELSKTYEMLLGSIVTSDYDLDEPINKENIYSNYITVSISDADAPGVQIMLHNGLLEKNTTENGLYYLHPISEGALCLAA